MNRSVANSQNAGSKSKFSTLNINAVFKGTSLKSSSVPASRQGVQGLNRSSTVKKPNLASAPRPFNLPSLKRENAGLDPNTQIVPAGGSGWGSTQDVSATPQPKEVQPSLVTAVAPNPAHSVPPAEERPSKRGYSEAKPASSVLEGSSQGVLSSSDFPTLGEEGNYSEQPNSASNISQINAHQYAYDVNSQDMRYNHGGHYRNYHHRNEESWNGPATSGPPAVAPHQWNVHSNHDNSGYRHNNHRHMYSSGENSNGGHQRYNQGQYYNYNSARDYSYDPAADMRGYNYYMGYAGQMPNVAYGYDNVSQPMIPCSTPQVNYYANNDPSCNFQPYSYRGRMSYNHKSYPMSEYPPYSHTHHQPSPVPSAVDYNNPVIASQPVVYTSAVPSSSSSSASCTVPQTASFSAKIEPKPLEEPQLGQRRSGAWANIMDEMDFSERLVFEDTVDLTASHDTSQKLESTDSTQSSSLPLHLDSEKAPLNRSTVNNNNNINNDEGGNHHHNNQPIGSVDSSDHPSLSTLSSRTTAKPAPEIKSQPVRIMQREKSTPAPSSAGLLPTPTTMEGAPASILKNAEPKQPLIFKIKDPYFTASAAATTKAATLKSSSYKTDPLQNSKKPLLNSSASRNLKPGHEKSSAGLEAPPHSSGSSSSVDRKVPSKPSSIRVKLPGATLQRHSFMVSLHSSGGDDAVQVEAIRMNDESSTEGTLPVQTPADASFRVEQEEALLLTDDQVLPPSEQDFTTVRSKSQLLKEKRVKRNEALQQIQQATNLHELPSSRSKDAEHVGPPKLRVPSMFGEGEEPAAPFTQLTPASPPDNAWKKPLRLEPSSGNPGGDDLAEEIGLGMGRCERESLGEILPMEASSSPESDLHHAYDGVVGDAKRARNLKPVKSSSKNKKPKETNSSLRKSTVKSTPNPSKIVDDSLIEPSSNPTSALIACKTMAAAKAAWNLNGANTCPTRKADRSSLSSSEKAASNGIFPRPRSLAGLGGVGEHVGIHSKPFSRSSFDQKAQPHSQQKLALSSAGKEADLNTASLLQTSWLQQQQLHQYYNIFQPLPNSSSSSAQVFYYNPTSFRDIDGLSTSSPSSPSAAGSHPGSSFRDQSRLTKSLGNSPSCAAPKFASCGDPKKSLPDARGKSKVASCARQEDPLLAPPLPMSGPRRDASVVKPKIAGRSGKARPRTGLKTPSELKDASTGVPRKAKSASATAAGKPISAAHVESNPSGGGQPQENVQASKPHRKMRPGGKTQSAVKKSSLVAPSVCGEETC